jgi:hypothetical protein
VQAFGIAMVMTVTDIKTDAFNQIVKDLRKEGWRRIEEYDNIDAWIDYGMVRLKKKGVILKFEWTNWDEGSVEGPDDVVQAIKSKYELK